MVQLMRSLVRLLANVIVYWALPIVGSALFSSLAAVIIAINPLLGGVVILAVVLLFVAYCLAAETVWQTLLWGALLVPYGLLAIIAPHWAVIWGLAISVLAFGVIAIPGAVLPHARPLITTAILAAVGLHAVLAFTVWSHGVVFLTFLGLLAVAVGSWLFSQAARPWEIRQARRTAGRLAFTFGLMLIVVGLFAPRLSIPEIHISVPRPLSSAWETISNHAEASAISSKRVLIGERAKTRALEELESDLQRTHKNRWEQGIQQVPKAPFTTEEWRELGVEQDP